MSVLRAAPDIAWLELDDVVYVARVPDGPIHVLAGPAAVVWVEGIGQDRGSLAERVAARTVEGPEHLRADIDAFVADACERGLLVEG